MRSHSYSLPNTLPTTQNCCMFCTAAAPECNDFACEVIRAHSPTPLQLPRIAACFALLRLLNAMTSHAKSFLKLGEGNRAQLERGRARSGGPTGGRCPASSGRPAGSGRPVGSRRLRRAWWAAQEQRLNETGEQASRSRPYALLIATWRTPLPSSWWASSTTSTAATGGVGVGSATGGGPL